MARNLVRSAAGDQKRQLQREARERTQLAIQDMSIKWLQFAAQPGNAAFAKWVLFLSDVYVVGVDKVKNAALIWEHFDILGRNALGPAPVLAKAVSRSPAMVAYLDLNQSKRGAPNENFARELFELFLLGEGNYTEQDIKESARAFTGYRQQFGVFRNAPGQHDPCRPNIFTNSAPGGAPATTISVRSPSVSSPAGYSSPRNFGATSSRVPCNSISGSCRTSD